MTAHKGKADKKPDKQRYNEDYFFYRTRLARSSAEVMVPMVIELVQPSSVVDVGCGTGDWLSVFREHGVDDVWGVDGAYVNKKLLKIPEERFITADLEHPLHFDRKFDLVVSLEVAEHLPSSHAESLVASLTALGPVVLFSAAIPHQGGRHHVNEQWPPYWVRLFSDKGYVVTDPLRRKVWYDEKVQVWYTQNTFVFVARNSLRNYPLLGKEYESHNADMLSVVHPKYYLQKVEEATLRHLLIRRPTEILVRSASSTMKGILPNNIFRVIRAVYRRFRGGGQLGE